MKQSKQGRMGMEEMPEDGWGLAIFKYVNFYFLSFK